MGGKPVELSNEEYHEVANIYMENLVERFYALMEETEGVDVEYSVGFRTRYKTNQIVQLIQESGRCHQFIPPAEWQIRGE